MPFVNVPGRQYTTPVTWHEDPVHVVEGPSTGNTYNHTIDFHSSTGPVVFQESMLASAHFLEGPGGPVPGSTGTNCAWGKVILGRAIDNRIWDGLCPSDDDGTGSAGGGIEGSTWDTGTQAPSVGVDSSEATAAIAGYLLRPWRLTTFDEPWMGSEALQDEYQAVQSAAFNALPGDGWFTEHENFYPTLVGIEIAPDENITGSTGVRTEGVTWMYSASGWGFYGFDAGLTSIWETGFLPNGTILTSYSGGLADWEAIPEEWMPTQTMLPFDGSLVQPEDEDHAAIPLTLASATLMSGTYPGDNATGGRDNQTLVVRAAWLPPRFRFYREGSGVPPQRVIGRPGDTVLGAGRAWGGGSTQQSSGGRSIGSIL